MFHSHAKKIAAVVICFFTWTSGGLFGIAQAAQDVAKRGNWEKRQGKEADTEERFVRLTEDLEAVLVDPKVEFADKKLNFRSSMKGTKALKSK